MLRKIGPWQWGVALCGLLYPLSAFAQVSGSQTSQSIIGCWEREFNASPPNSKVKNPLLRLCFAPNGLVVITSIGDGHGASDDDTWADISDGNIRIGDETCGISFKTEEVAELERCRLSGLYLLNVMK